MNNASTYSIVPTRPLAAIAALAAMVVVSACGEADVTCGDGLKLVDGKCVVTSAGTAPFDAGAADGDAAGGGGTDTSVTDASDTGLSDACTPKCAPGNACGDDGCGGSCGTCKGAATCVAGLCHAAIDCVPKCGGKACGADGCGGTCGDCKDPALPVCHEGQCVAKCIPSCVGKACGSDGCGGTCGSCGADQKCADQAGHCVPSGWTCPATKYAAADQCDCGCGAPDPDCAASGVATLGCAPTEVCANGVCTSPLPKGWTCPHGQYDDGHHCDCGCGAIDPDCKLPGVTVFGCAAGQTCVADGTCGKCEPNCKDANGKTKSCGSDGCGGSCGSCPDQGSSKPPLACIDGACVDGCGPKPLACQTATCGSDGCGGSCGTCGAGAFCHEGQCKPEPGKSCVGYCKGKAPGGCSCEDGCDKAGSCCSDFIGVCVCKSDCTGRVCGDDGCGGTCGICDDKAKPHCGPKGQCHDKCVPVCTHKACGSDGCGGTCGSCGKGTSCVEGTSSAVCMPDAWTCPSFHYGDGSLCDCSCGAPDPDCAKIALTVGCPMGAACDKDTGVCKVSYCNHNGDCKLPKWCVGQYPAGSGLRKGVCEAPDPAANPEYGSCTTDLACANGLCGKGLCRTPCQQDSHCSKGATCVGFPVVDGLTLNPLGIFGGCDSVAKLGATCKAKTDCAADQLCLAVIDPSTQKPVYRCGAVTSNLSEGAKCEASHLCELGLVCHKSKCMRPCPGGAKDCPFGLACTDAVLHGGPSSGKDDDVTVPTCTPK